MKTVGMGNFEDIRYEGSIWELAGAARGLKVGEELTFASGKSDDIDIWGEWCGIKKTNMFDNDNDIYFIGYWGGEGNVRMYQMSEYDPAIGNKFDEIYGENSWYATEELKEQAIVAHMITSFINDFERTIPTVVTWEGKDGGNFVVKATADYTGGGIYVFMGKLYNGKYFMMDSSWMEPAFVDADPSKVGDGAFTVEWQEEHFVENPFKTEEENKFFWNSVIDWILENGEGGNYLEAEIAERKMK